MTSTLELPFNCEPAQIIVSVVITPETQNVVADLSANNLRFEFSLGSYAAYCGGERSPKLLAEASHQFLLFTVPDGDIAGAINRVRSQYVARDAYGEPLVHAVPNRTSQYEASGLGAPLRLGGKHWDYLDRLRVPSARRASDDGNSINVAIVDSGVYSTFAGVAVYHDLTSPLNPRTSAMADNDGHGSAMAALVQEVAPCSNLIVVRASDTKPPLMFDIMAGIAIAVFDYQAEIVNLSIALDTGTCHACGSASGLALRYLLASVNKVSPAVYRAKDKPIFVAAVGNQYATPPTGMFREPAARDGVVAVGSVNSSGIRSAFSNYGTPKAEYLMAPGGERDACGNALEDVGEGANNVKCLGTSVATAYASGILAVLRAQIPHRTLGSADFVSHTLDYHCARVYGQTAAEYGAGEISYS